MLIIFCCFAGLMILSALMVVFSTNSVYSVLWLIMTFINAAGLILMSGAEFLSMLLIIVYVGAVAVLFLFVVMMIELKSNKISLPVSIIGATIVFLELYSIIVLKSNELPIIRHSFKKQNAYEIGSVLYTDYFTHFQMAGIILLAAIIGCIYLTLRPKNSAYKRQDPNLQNLRNKENSIRLVKNIK